MSDVSLYEETRRVKNPTVRKKGKHGLAWTRIYRIWRMMIWRCENPKAAGFRYYGGRGIVVCQRWHDVVLFVEDMGPTYFAGATIDRIDTNGNYEPENCKWSTTMEQSRNKTNTQKFTHDGLTLCAPDWADHFGVSRHVFLTRATKWGLAEAVLRTAAIPPGDRADKRFLRGDGPSHKCMDPKLADEVVKAGLTDEPIKSIAARLGVGYCTVCDILTGRSWRRAMPEVPRPIRREGVAIKAASTSDHAQKKLDESIQQLHPLG